MGRKVRPTLDAFFERIEADNGRAPRTHELRAALTDKELLLWEKAHPGLTVSDELLSLLRRSNGFRLLLNKNSPGGADCCFSALKDLPDARSFMYGEDADDDMVPGSWFALAADADSSQVLVIDMATGEFFDVDPVDSDHAKSLSKSIGGALAWLFDFFPDPSEGR